MVARLFTKELVQRSTHHTSSHELRSPDRYIAWITATSPTAYSALAASGAPSRMLCAKLTSCGS